MEQYLSTSKLEMSNKPTYITGFISLIMKKNKNIILYMVLNDVTEWPSTDVITFFQPTFKGTVHPKIKMVICHYLLYLFLVIFSVDFSIVT